jgi:hypothetical protein
LQIGPSHPILGGSDFKQELARVIVQLVGVIAALIVLWYAKKAFESADPAKLARMLKPLGGLAVLGLAGFLFSRGQTEIALAVGGFGLYLLGVVKSHKLGALFGNEPISQMRSAMIEIEVMRSGDLRGAVLAGPYMGRALQDLTQELLLDIRAQCRREDPYGAQLLEAYLDRRFPGWRAAGEDDLNTGRSVQRATASMSEDEAYEILGLAKGASREDITRAHRTLIKKLHPDHGGTTALAARVNEAKSILMRRHG